MGAQMKSYAVVLLLYCGLLAIGCSSDGGGTCETNADCPDDKRCQDGACVAPDETDCEDDTDCPRGYFCDRFLCKRMGGFDTTPRDSEGRARDVGVDADSEPDTPDSGPDLSPPNVTSITPSDGATGVAVDTEVVVEFDEPVRKLSIRPGALKLVGPNNATVEATLDASDPTRVVLTPNQPLHAISPYRVVVTDSVQDRARNPVAGAPVEARFSTAFDELSNHRMLARRWAPWIYQGIRETSGSEAHNDIPTTIDFDGDTNAANNEENARMSGGTPPTAHLYYHVTSSETHHFLYYIAYYPTRVAEGATEHTEHNFAGAVLVVDRSAGELVLVEGLKLRSSGPLWLAFTPKSSGITSIGQYSSLKRVDDANWQLEEGTHYPMYIKSGNHETCNWYTRGIGGATVKCAHNPEQFPSDEGGVLIKPGQTAQSYDQAQSMGGGLPTMTYALVPLAVDFWGRRSWTGPSSLFDARFAYEPNPNVGQRPSGYPGEDAAHRLPKAMSTPDSESVGQTPFRWESFASGDGDGQWLLDPVVVAGDRFAFPGESDDFSETYCFNLFFAIDAHDSTSNPDCRSAGGGDVGPDAGPDVGFRDAGPDAGDALDAGN